MAENGEPRPQRLVKSLDTVFRMRLLFAPENRLHHLVIPVDKLNDNLSAERAKPVQEHGDRNIRGKAHVVDDRETDNQVRLVSLVEGDTLAAVPALIW